VRRRLSKPLEQKVEHYRRTLEMLSAAAQPLSLLPVLTEELRASTRPGPGTYGWRRS